jgi:hypothetical protein
MRNLLPFYQPQFRIEYSEPYFSILPEVSRDRNEEFQSNFTSALAPALCTSESNDRLSKAINEGSELSPIILKQLKIALSEDKRCVKIRDLATSFR